MTHNATITELEFLAARLTSVAAELRRAAVLLTAAGDLDRLQARLSTIVADRRPHSAAESDQPVREAAPPIGDRHGAVKRGAAEAPDSRLLGFAVFHQDTEPRLVEGKKRAVGRPPF